MIDAKAIRAKTLKESEEFLAASPVWPMDALKEHLALKAADLGHPEWVKTDAELAKRSDKKS